MGFLPNGDLILVDYKKIYKYSFINKPTSIILWKYWECSQRYYIEPHKSLNEIDRFVYQTKLFLFNKGLMTQWDLLTMTFEMQYNLVDYEGGYSMVINKNQTLLALKINRKIDIYSMETGMHISRYG